MTGAFNFSRSFQYRVDGISADAVNGWQSEFVFFRYFEDFLNVITSDNAGFYEIKNFRHGCVLFRLSSTPQWECDLFAHSGQAFRQRRNATPKNYCFARSSSMATAGSFLPSTNSRNAPPPVEM